MAKKRNLKMWLVMSVLLAGMAPAIAAGGTIYVDAGASAGGNGQTWATAYKYLQDALYKPPTSGDQIWVAEGTYKPDANSANPGGSADRYATFQLINGVAIYGGFAGGESSLDERNWETNETILSGDLDGNDVQVSEPCDLLTEPTRAENSYHVVTGSGTNATAILDGFTITAGNANGSGSDSWGGGMYLNNSNPMVLNCMFTENSAADGGGICCDVQSSPGVSGSTFSVNLAICGGGISCWWSSNPTLTDCTFSRNASTGPSHPVPQYRSGGGGMYNHESSPALVRCTFKDNSASWWGGGMYNSKNSPTLTNCTFSGNSSHGDGGGIYNLWSSPMLTNCTLRQNSASIDCGGMGNEYSNPTLTNCTFTDNRAALNGGGVLNWRNSSSTLTSCTFSGNSASMLGGGMHNSYSSSTVTNCTFSPNSAEVGGGMCNSNGSSTTVTNCTFASNSATNGNAMACDSYRQSYPSTVQLANCILWDGGDEIWNNDGSTITITYSDVQGGWGGEGNIDADPLFIGPDGLDGIPGTADDEDNNIHLSPSGSPCFNAGDPSGDYSGQVDLDGQPRVAYGRVDMGADEVFLIAGDFEPDGDVDFADFAIFAGSWLLGVE